MNMNMNYNFSEKQMFRIITRTVELQTRVVDTVLEALATKYGSVYNIPSGKRGDGYIAVPGMVWN